MSSIAAAHEAASPRTAAAVISRTVIHSGPVVKIKVPADATEGSYLGQKKRVPFLQFSRTLPGGVVNLFVHTGALHLRGTTILAKATVMKKVLDDGREFLYVDLAPLPPTAKVTHRLAFMPDVVGSWHGKDHVTFGTPKPIIGRIIFAPPNAKVAVAEVLKPTARN